MGQMLHDATGRKVTSIAHPAYHMAVFEAYSEYICRSGARPLLVIAPINLRSFSPEWGLRPGYQFSDQIELLTAGEGAVLQRLWSRVHTTFSSEDAFTLAEWKRQPVYFGSGQCGIVKDYVTGEDAVDPELIKGKYIFHYGADLNPHHRRLESFRRMIENLQGCGVPMLFYITPIDVDLGEQYVGPRFREIVDENIATVMAIGDEYGVPILDLTYDVRAADFDHPNTPNEHLREEGRCYVVGVLAAAIDAGQDDIREESGRVQFQT